jgi:hypothetical protein
MHNETTFEKVKIGGGFLSNEESFIKVSEVSAGPADLADGRFTGYFRPFESGAVVFTS